MQIIIATNQSYPELNWRRMWDTGELPSVVKALAEKKVKNLIVNEKAEEMSDQYDWKILGPGVFIGYIKKHNPLLPLYQIRVDA